MKNNFLTDRELNIFNMLISNKSTKDIAQALYISEKTVRNHISNVIGKLGVENRTQAIVILMKNGMIKI